MLHYEVPCSRSCYACITGCRSRLRLVRSNEGRWRDNVPTPLSDQGFFKGRGPGSTKVDWKIHQSSKGRSFYFWSPTFVSDWRPGWKDWPRWPPTWIKGHAFSNFERHSSDTPLRRWETVGLLLRLAQGNHVREECWFRPENISKTLVERWQGFTIVL